MTAFPSSSDEELSRAILLTEKEIEYRKSQGDGEIPMIEFFESQLLRLKTQRFKLNQPARKRGDFMGRLLRALLPWRRKPD